MKKITQITEMLKIPSVTDFWHICKGLLSHTEVLHVKLNEVETTVQ
jgi:hypothetical protein